MKFRTEIEPVKTGHEIHHGDSVLLLGSCFTDNIGERLAIDGFNAVYNPLGPLYNPLSIARCLKAALSHKRYDATDLTAARAAVIVSTMPRATAAKTGRACSRR